MESDNFIYKIEKCEPVNRSDYAIRYNPKTNEVFAKVKGNNEFVTSFKDNNSAFEVYLSGTEVTKDVYERFAELYKINVQV